MHSKYVIANIWIKTRTIVTSIVTTWCHKCLLQIPKYHQELPPWQGATNVCRSSLNCLIKNPPTMLPLCRGQYFIAGWCTCLQCNSLSRWGLCVISFMVWKRIAPLLSFLWNSSGMQVTMISHDTCLHNDSSHDTKMCEKGRYLNFGSWN